jgi:hypothetical protein
MSTASVSISGNTTTVTLTITFSASFAGAKNIYGNSVNTSGVAGTTQQIGTWTVPGVSIMVSPSSGTASSQTFVFTYSGANLAQEHLLFNSALNGAGACYLYYDQPSQMLYMANDQGTGFTQSAAPGTSATLSNSQCSIPMATASVTVSGNTVTISLAISFSVSFAGPQNIYVNTVNTSGLAGTAQQIGTWTVPGVSITVNPSSGSGLTQQFTFTYTRPNLAQEHLLFNSSLSGAGACYLYYAQASQMFYMANDQGTAFTQSAGPGTSATLSNSQCSVPMTTTSVSISGNSATLTLTINFSTSFTGAQNIYVNSVNTSNVAGTTQQIGTWTP